jgi:hypothetical protein
MTGYKSKKAAAQAKTIDEVNWLDHEPDGLAQPAQDKLHEQYDDMYIVYLNGVYDGKKQRPWVELEGEEIRYLWEEATKPDRSTMTVVTSFAKDIEAKLKEKNNG